MKGCLKGALVAATITTVTHAQEVGASNTPLELDASVEFLQTGVSAGEQSATFILEHNLQIQPMYRPPHDIYSGVEYDQFAVSCRDLTTDFEKSIKFMEEALRPTLIRVDLNAIRPSIIEAAEKARDQCSPAIM